MKERIKYLISIYIYIYIYNEEKSRPTFQIKKHAYVMADA